MPLLELSRGHVDTGDTMCCGPCFDSWHLYPPSAAEGVSEARAESGQASFLGDMILPSSGQANRMETAGFNEQRAKCRRRTKL